MENVKVIIWGLGAMGGGIADMLLKKKGVDIVGVVDWEAKVGKSMYEVIKTPEGDRLDVIIGAADVVIRPAGSGLDRLYAGRGAYHLPPGQLPVSLRPHRYG